MYPIPEKPTISVIIPALNEEKLIASTLRNAREVVPEAEFIVVDGGSRDNTMKIAREYATVYGSHGNVGSARNTGAKVASGDIIVFLDADTTITRQFVDRAIRVFRDPGVVGAGGLIMPEDTNLIEETAFYFFNLLIMLSFAIRKPNLAGTCVAYKREPFLEVGGFDVDMAASEDFDLCKRISKKGRVVFLKDVVVRTSRRRLKKFGLLGLTADWLKVTVEYFILSRRPQVYRAFR